MRSRRRPSARYVLHLTGTKSHVDKVALNLSMTMRLGRKRFRPAAIFPRDVDDPAPKRSEIPLRVADEGDLQLGAETKIDVLVGSTICMSSGALMLRLAPFPLLLEGVS